MGFEQIRKKGKLPGFTIEEKYDLEYGKGAVLEMLDDGFIAGKRVLLIDDVLATGGTVFAGARLVERLGGTVVGLACVIEIPVMGGRAKLLHYPVQSLISVLENTLVTGVEYCVDIVAFDHRSKFELPILVERLSEPLGIAFPGGHIEYESAYAAASRELFEETGCTAIVVEYLETLASLGRDPRGEKVSIVVKVEANTSSLKGEAEKTRPFIPQRGAVPPLETFVLGHNELWLRL